MPEAWAVDAARYAEAGIPEEHRQALAKTDIALMEIDQVMAFRQGLTRRGLIWAVGMPEVENVDETAVPLHWPKASTGRSRKHPVPSEDPVPADQALQHVEWHRISWRRPRSWLSSPPCACDRPKESNSGRAATCRARRPGW